MPGFGRTISDTCDGEKEKCEGEGVSCQTLLKQKCALFMSVMKITCLVTIFSFILLFLFISEYTLLI